MLIILRSLIFLINTQTFLAYQWSVIEEDIDICAMKPTCDGRAHTFCFGNQPVSSCRQFKLFTMKNKLKRHLIDGHNGLRNRVAKIQHKTASNMNLLHWDDDLQQMAEKWVLQCSRKQDSCDYIYKKDYTVGQNFQYYEKFPENRFWAINALRSWYLEGNHMDESIIEKFTFGNVTRYTQLMWATTQFVGCAGARMLKGYVFVCNYYPKGNIVGEPVYKTSGSPCTDCSLDRPSCSRTFKGLCGIDRRYISASRKFNEFNGILLIYLYVTISCIQVKPFIIYY